MDRFENYTRFECSFVNIFFTRFECSFVNIFLFSLVLLLECSLGLEISVWT